MPRLKPLFGALVLFIASLACETIMGRDPSEIETPASSISEPAVEELPPEAAACPNITDRIIENAFSSTEPAGEETMDFGARDQDNATYIITYLVSGDEISQPYEEDVPADLQDEQVDTSAHKRIWDYFAALIPAENRDILTQFTIITDGPDKVLAAVGQTYNDPYLWSLEVDIVDSQDRDSLTYTLVHEFAHLLTLGSDQVPPSETIFNNPDDNDIYLKEVSACSNFFPGEGCANADSYINEFYNRFWVEVYAEWNDINLEQDDDIYYKRLDSFYHKYRDQFVTDYSVTHPAEDIAESFAFFVLSPQPAGNTVADQKILFFYQYPELGELRAKMLNNLCTSFPE